jgi:hypothetical protein
VLAGGGNRKEDGMETVAFVVAIFALVGVAIVGIAKADDSRVLHVEGKAITDVECRLFKIEAVIAKNNREIADNFDRLGQALGYEPYDTPAESGWRKKKGHKP